VGAQELWPPLTIDAAISAICIGVARTSRWPMALCAVSGTSIAFGIALRDGELVGRLAVEAEGLGLLDQRLVAHLDPEPGEHVLHDTRIASCRLIELPSAQSPPPKLPMSAWSGARRRTPSSGNEVSGCRARARGRRPR
jgi:hypothetical protein